MKRTVHDLTQPGWAIALASMMLFVIGLASIYASSEVHVSGSLVSSKQFAAKQALSGVLSVVVAAMVLKLGYQRIARNSYLIFGACLVLLLPMVIAKMLHTSFGGLVPESRGAYRSINLPGYNLQPSELMKVGYILALAWYLRLRSNFRTFWGLLVPFLWSAIPMALILLEPDLGTGILFVPVLFGMLFVAGARMKHMGIIVALGVLAMPVMWVKMKPYQRSRVMALFMQSDTLRQKIAAEPEKYASTGVDRREALQWEVSSGMQLVRSKAALGSGGVFGQGWGQGTYVEYSFLPDRHNDFVFAIVGHQWGLAGCLIVIFCYGLIVLAGVEIATVTAEPFGRLLAMGVVTLISAQAAINMGMTVGLMPITGMTLPFVSYGGSSLLSNAIALALLVSVSQNRPFMLTRRPFEWAESGKPDSTYSRAPALGK